MKNVAIVAVLLGVLGNAANAQSAIAVTEASNFAMTMNSSAVKQWIETTPATKQDVDLKVEDQAAVKSMVEVSLKLDKQLEDKMTQELDYAMH